MKYASKKGRCVPLILALKSTKVAIGRTLTTHVILGICGEDGFFSGAIIDCPEQMGMPCDGEWVLEDGACCSTCVENTDSDCGSISITLNNGWNMIGFACSENTNALAAFTAIQDKIVIAKDGVGNAYLPDWDFNGIGDLERGYGYLIKVSEEITNYNICD